MGIENGVGRRLTDDADIAGLLERARTVAIVGLSSNPVRDSHGIGRYLQSVGLRVLPVHPAGGEILGERAYPSLEALVAVERPDIVDVFRRPEALPALVEEAVRLKAGPLWFQLGVTHPEAEARALAGGLDLVVNRCIYIEHRRLVARP